MSENVVENIPLEFYIENERFKRIKEAEEALKCLLEDLSNIYAELDLAIRHATRIETDLNLAKRP